ncbi:NPC intracellular cholesterol transporter 2-like [Babylonia areolata]|uniref:NPC intracellular cholesterol transporter 2-like n=1 Tax=Babylonia areolata TaxID=304850 RepID=UPI003FD460CA
MMWKAVAVAVLSCLAVVTADIVKYKDCGSVSGTIKSVDVTPCPAEPCQFKRTKTINVTVDYTANIDITKATTKVYGFILGAKVPFPVPDDACQDMTCPVSKGSTVTYKNAVYVKPEYPNVSVVVQWEVHDQNDNLIVCFDVPVQIS